MFDTDPRTEAMHTVDLLHEGAVRAVFRALIAERDHEAQARLIAEIGPRARSLDLGEPIFREWLLEALEYRISPPDEDDLGLTRPTGSTTLPFSLADSVAFLAA